MKNFLQYTLATIVGIIVLNIIGFLFLIIFIAAAASSEAPTVKDNSVLLAKFNVPIIDRADENPFSSFMSGSLELDGSLGLDQVLKDIEKAKNDEKISGIFLQLSSVPSGMAALEEVRDALIDFKESGKFIIAHSDTYTQKGYYLASTADKIYLTPTGEHMFRGLSAQVTFFKRALDKLDIDMQIIRHGSFKSAVEPLINEKMSPENREQLGLMISSMWEQYVNEISEARGIPVESLNTYADELSAGFDDQALEKGLVDGLKYYDEILDELKELTDTDADDDVPAISLKKYADVPADKKDVSKNRIAVIYAMGNVVMGKDGEGTISSERISKAIRKARTDKKVKAIVFRVNSGGGSALASEVIYREAKLAAEEKPFVASLGDVAASGGYYIVCPADTIVASETTITGSIGVFGVIPNFETFLNERIGVTTDVVKTNKFSDMGNVSRPLDPEEKEILQNYVDDVYTTFVNHVAEGRGMEFDEVDAVGGGRVWAGKDAMEIGLIDVFGGLERSIEIAAEMAGLEDYRVQSLPALEDPFTFLMNQLEGGIRSRLIEKELGESYILYKRAREISETKGVQAVMPYEIEVY
jgi:protease-4